MSQTSGATADLLAGLSTWIDEGNTHRDPEAVTWGRLAKVSEECGEVIAAFIGATGQNPRKGVTCGMDAVRRELLDVALTALCAVEHLNSDTGTSMDEFAAHVRYVARRAGLMGGEAA
jgi:NTP pyrophosphatase (non-canonical NTP hydrolase)